MKKEELKTLIIDTISCIGDYNNPEEVKGTDSLRDDLGKDSLDFAQFSIDIERKLNISIPDEEWGLQGNPTIDELTDFIYSKL